MHAEIKTVKDPELRVQVVEQRSYFDSNPLEFRINYNDSQNIFCLLYTSPSPRD